MCSSLASLSCWDDSISAWFPYVPILSYLAFLSIGPSTSAPPCSLFFLLWPLARGKRWKEASKTTSALVLPHIRWWHLVGVSSVTVRDSVPRYSSLLRGWLEWKEGGSEQPLFPASGKRNLPLALPPSMGGADIKLWPRFFSSRQNFPLGLHFSSFSPDFGLRTYASVFPEATTFSL